MVLPVTKREVTSGSQFSGQGDELRSRHVRLHVPVE